MQGGLNFNNDNLKEEIFKECNTLDLFHNL
jgi:hypothetical protein